MFPAKWNLTWSSVPSKMNKISNFMTEKPSTTCQAMPFWRTEDLILFSVAVLFKILQHKICKWHLMLWEELENLALIDVYTSKSFIDCSSNHEFDFKFSANIIQWFSDRYSQCGWNMNKPVMCNISNVVKHDYFWYHKVLL